MANSVPMHRNRLAAGASSSHNQNEAAARCILRYHRVAKLSIRGGQPNENSDGDVKAPELPRETIIARAV